MTEQESRDGEKEENQEEAPEQTYQNSALSLSWGLSASRDPDEQSGPVLWLITFTDVMALLLTFFVMLYSMAVPEEKRWEEMTDGITAGFSKFESPKWHQGPQDSINIDKLDFSNALDLSYLKTLVDEIIAKDDNLKNVVVILQKDRLILSLPSDLLFESGQADVTLDGKRALFSLGESLSNIRNRIEIIGHTDPRPVQSEGGRYASNWELSLDRASNVAAVLENVGYTRPTIIRGLSSGRYEELPTQLSEENRLGFSRRVDIVIMKDDGSQRLLMQMN